MPVFKASAKTSPRLPGKRKDELLATLKKERGEPSATGAGPTIYEIPLGESDKLDVLVVWDAFDGLPAEERSWLISEAYADLRGKVLQTLGVTFNEAQQENLLPYGITSLAREEEASLESRRQAMIEVGGIELPNKTVQLRFPAYQMAEEVLRKLIQRMPNGYWTITERISPSLEVA